MAWLIADVGGYYAGRHSMIPPWVAGVAVVVFAVVAVALIRGRSARR